MKIDFSKNTLIITLYNPDNVGLVLSAIEEMETMLCKKLDVDEDEDYVNCKVIGYCPECDRLYSWYNHYKYEKSSDFGLTF
jgi:hypothetical protein